MAETELEDAVARSTRNPNARWPERGTANRLEPECWPETAPLFTFAAGSRVFTIGSCFARNVEMHLSALGFDVPTRRFLDDNVRAGRHGGDEILNKYTPPSIYQELAWTKRIRDRDGTVTEEDIAPFLLEIGDGKVVDLQHRLTGQFGQTRAEALAQRQDFYGLFRQAFDSETVIITLGLIECWLDRLTGQFVEFGPSLPRHNAGGRFAFKQLCFQEAYDYTRRAIELLDGRNILLTTSPVPLARTFTGDDVIVANTYAKSVLRAVAGQIAAELTNVDYFPSYESVMLTKQTHVWANDLTHVEGAFVGRIVGRMCERYATETSPKAAALDQWLNFANLVQHRRFADAGAVLAKLNLEEPGVAPRFALPLAEMFLEMGDHAKALHHVRLAHAIAAAAGERACFDLLRCAQIFEGMRDLETAEAIRTGAIGALGNTALIISLLRRLPASGATDDAHRIIAHIEGKLSSNLDLLSFAILTLETAGDFEGAARTCRVAVRAHPQNANMLMRFGAMLCRQKKLKRGLVLLERAHRLDPENIDVLKKLISVCLEDRNLERAEQHARTLIDVAPRDASGFVQLASTLRRMGRKLEALEHAKRAAELEPGSVRYRNYVEELTKVTTRR